MNTVMIVLLKPLFLVALMGLVVLPIEMTLHRIFPDGSLKRTLFDKTLRDRRPWIYGAWWFVIVLAMISIFALTVPLR